LSFLGYGIFATTEFSPGDFLLEYVGDLIEPSVADEIADQTYVYYFSWASTNYRLISYMHLIIVGFNFALYQPLILLYLQVFILVL